MPKLPKARAEAAAARLREADAQGGLPCGLRQAAGEGQVVGSVAVVRSGAREQQDAVPVVAVVVRAHHPSRRSVEAAGILRRDVIDDARPPRVEYRLTDEGRRLRAVLDALAGARILCKADNLQRTGSFTAAVLVAALASLIIALLLLVPPLLTRLGL